MRPLLVTPRLVTAAHGEVREALDVKWAPFLSALGLLPVPVSYDVAPDAYASLDPAGLLLTGGNDLSIVTDDPLSHRRDLGELRFLAAARARGWPVLGVCRGMQLLASEAGARVRTIDGHVATTHPLAVDANAPYASLFARVDGANSFHGYAVELSPESTWVACARAEDGTVEAIASAERPEVGIMWHPERYLAPRACDLAIFKAVLA